MSSESAFLRAVEAGDVAEINRLAALHPDVDLNHLTASGHSLLWWAVLAVDTPNSAVVRALLDLRTTDNYARLDLVQRWMGQRLVDACPGPGITSLIREYERHYRARPAAAAQPGQRLAEQFGTHFNTHQADEEVRRSFGRWLNRYCPAVAEQAISCPLQATERPHQTDLALITAITPAQVQASQQAMYAFIDTHTDKHLVRPAFNRDFAQHDLNRLSEQERAQRQQDIQRAEQCLTHQEAELAKKMIKNLAGSYLCILPSAAAVEEGEQTHAPMVRVGYKHLLVLAWQVACERDSAYLEAGTEVTDAALRTRQALLLRVMAAGQDEYGHGQSTCMPCNKLVEAFSGIDTAASLYPKGKLSEDTIRQSIAVAVSAALQASQSEEAGLWQRIWFEQLTGETRTAAGELGAASQEGVISQWLASRAPQLKAAIQKDLDYDTRRQETKTRIDSQLQATFGEPELGREPTIAVDVRPADRQLLSLLKVARVHLGLKLARQEEESFAARQARINQQLWDKHFTTAPSLMLDNLQADFIQLLQHERFFGPTSYWPQLAARWLAAAAGASAEVQQTQEQALRRVLELVTDRQQRAVLARHLAKALQDCVYRSATEDLSLSDVLSSLVHAKPHAFSPPFWQSVALALGQVLFAESEADLTWLQALGAKDFAQVLALSLPALAQQAAPLTPEAVRHGLKTTAFQAGLAKRLNLQGHDLGQMDCRGHDWCGIDLTGAILSQADLRLLTCDANTCFTGVRLPPEQAEGLLRLAVYANNPSLAQAALRTWPENERLAAVTTPDRFGRTVLHWAARQCNSAVITALLGALPALAGGSKLPLAAVTTPDSFGFTVLHRAADNTNPGVITALLRALPISADGSKLPLAAVTTPDIHGDTLLHRAANNNNPEVIIALLGALPISADGSKLPLAALTTPNRRGDTLLHWAANNNNPEVITALLGALPISADGSKLPLATVITPDSHGDTLLHRAANNNNPEVIIALLGALPISADGSKLPLAALTTPNRRGDTLLHWAANNNNPEVITALLGALPISADGSKLSLATVITPDSHGDKLLHRAANNNNPEVITALLGALPEGQRLDAVTTPDSFGFTVLHRAADNTNPGVITALLGALPEGQRLDAVTTTDIFGTMLLHRAANNNNPEVIIALLGALPEGQRLDAVTTPDSCGDTLLHRAARNNNPTLITAVLGALPEGQRLAAVIAPDSHGDKVLHRAARNNNPTLITAVLGALPEGQRLAAVTTPDSCGDTLLHRAADHSNPEFITALLRALPEGQRLAAVTTPDSGGDTLLHRAADHSNPEVITALLRALPVLADGSKLPLAAVTTPDSCGDTLLHRAADHSNPEVITALLRALPEGQRLAVVTTPDSVGDTLLHRAADHSNPEVITALLRALPESQRLAAVTTPDSGGDTLLHRAADHSNPEVITALLRALPVLADGSKIPLAAVTTLLRRAANNNNPEVITALLGALPALADGSKIPLAAVTTPDSVGRTLLYWAVRQCNPEFITALLGALPALADGSKLPLAAVTTPDIFGQTALWPSINRYGNETPDVVRTRAQALGAAFKNPVSLLALREQIERCKTPWWASNYRQFYCVRKLYVETMGTQADNRVTELLANESLGLTGGKKTFYAVNGLAPVPIGAVGLLFYTDIALGKSKKCSIPWA